MSELTQQYYFEEVTFISDRLASEIDIKNVVSDFDVFEHLDKPYVTAELTIAETSRFYEKTDILGGEKIRVTIKSAISSDDSKSITKTFYINKVIGTIKSTERDNTVIFHLVEDVKYISNLINVNKSFRGKPTEIIEKVGKLINKKIISSNNDVQDMKVIVPNVSPLEAMAWIKNRASTTDGYPFYLFSTFVEDDLQFLDLGTMIQRIPITGQYPFTNYQSTASSLDIVEQRRTILNYEHRDVEDLYTMISRGFIGSKYTYINTMDEKLFEFDFNIVQDLLKNISKLLDKKQRNPLYSSNFEYGGKKFHELQSKNIFRISGAHSYDTEDRILGYGEEEDVAKHKLMIISDAMDTLLKKSPLSIIVTGTEFITGKQNLTLGNNIDIKFLSSDPHASVEENLFDEKMSGKYMIYAARHMFKAEKYDVRLSCVKLANGRTS